MCEAAKVKTKESGGNEGVHAPSKSIWYESFKQWW